MRKYIGTVTEIQSTDVGAILIAKGTKIFDNNLGAIPCITTNVVNDNNNETFSAILDSPFTGRRYIAEFAIDNLDADTECKMCDWSKADIYEI